MQETRCARLTGDAARSKIGNLGKPQRALNMRTGTALGERDAVPVVSRHLKRF